MQQADIRKVRASVHQQCGKKVMIQLDRGRNKVDIQEGVIQNAYPSVFTILVNDEREENPPQLLSFSYSEIITRDIRSSYFLVFHDIIPPVIPPPAHSISDVTILTLSPFRVL